MTKAIREGLLGLQIDESKKARGPSKAISESASRGALKEDYEHWAKKNYPSLFGVEKNAQGRPNPRADKEVNDKLVALAKLDPTTAQDKSPEEILKTAQGPYMQWLIRCLKNSSYEEMERSSHEYHDQLSAFDDLKKRNRLPEDKRDIMKYKDLHELMVMLQGLGGDFASEEGSAVTVSSDFKQELQDIRGFICRLCRLEDGQIDQSIQKWTDVMDYIGGNAKWEIWAAKNFWATMIFDRWGNGAGWCVGGMLGNNYGMEQVRQAQRYYGNYDAGGATYVCFQQTDKNAPRPDNKFLITLGPNGSEPETSAGYQFNNSDNRPQGGYGKEAQMDAFGAFLIREGLYDIFKASRFSGCEVFAVEENKRRLEAGEPYEYVGGRIREIFRPLIKTISFTDSRGQHRNVNVEGCPEILELSSIENFTVGADLAEGKPYVYVRGVGDTSEIKPKEILPLIKEIVVPDTYSFLVPWRVRTDEKGADGRVVYESREFVGIYFNAFRGCKNLKKVVVSGNVKAFSPRWVAINGGVANKDAIDATYMDGVDVEIELHDSKCYVAREELNWFRRHAKIVPGPVPDPRGSANESLSESVPTVVGKSGALSAGEDLNSRLLAKIDAISRELAKELEENGFGDVIDPELIKKDMIRDCGLMGDVVDVSELDVDNNPFDAETKRMHDGMKVDTQMAAMELLRVTPEEFSRRIISGLMAERRAIAAGRGRLGGPSGAIGAAPKRLGRR